MSKLILYGAKISPPSRAVVMLVRALDLNVNIQYMNLLKNEQLKADFVKKNPHHTIPTLDDNGAILWDSHAINAYLVTKYAKDDSLYPKDPLQRAKVDQCLHFDSGVLFARFRFIIAPILREGMTEIPADRIENIHKAYELTEALLAKNKYLVGDSLTLGDINCLATLSTVMRLIPIDAVKFPNLAAWLERLAQLPYYKENEMGAKELIQLLNHMLEQNRAKNQAK